MSSKQTSGSQEKKPMPENWSPTQLVGGGIKPAKPTAGEVDPKLQEMIDEGIIDENRPNRNIVNENSVGADDSIRSTETNDIQDSLQTQATESPGSKEPSIPTVTSKRTTPKQRKESLEEYRGTFLTVPKLEDRKPVFISCDVRDRIDEIVHRLGGRGRSVSGFIENLARHHLEIYQEDVDGWKKL